MEKIFEVIGLEGAYQKILFQINLFTGVLTCIYLLQIPYLTKHPSFYVQKLKSEVPNTIYEMEYSPELCNMTLYSISKNPKKSIINWSYTFYLYCERESYNTILTSIIFIGGILGSLFILPLPDKYGRAILKYIALVSLILHLNLLCIVGPIHIIFINFMGGMISQIFPIGYALFIEFFPKNKNGILVGILNAVYSLTGVLFCLFFLFANNWRLLFLITSVIHSYYTYITIKYFIESPRWLHSIGNEEGCISAITEVAFFNDRIQQWNDFQKNNPDIINKLGTTFLEKEGEKNINNKNNNNKTYNLFHILQFKSQRATFIKMISISVVCAYNYYGIILNLGKMKGNFYLNSIFAFLGEFTAEIISGKLADKFGRIKIFTLSCLIGTIGYILYLISPYFKFLFVFLAMMGYSGTFNVMAIYIPEIFPTKIRNITFAYISLLSRLSPICVPILTQVMPNIIDYTFILCGIIYGLIGITLEETLGKKILDIIPEEEEENENIKMQLIN